RTGQQLVVVESMKMEHVVSATVAGVVERIDVSVGDTVMQGHTLLVVAATDSDQRDSERDNASPATTDAGSVRTDLIEVMERHDVVLDHRRPEAVARRRATQQRTARENVADLVDEGTFVEYAPLIVAAQRYRRSLEELIARTPADGLVGGIGKVAG